MKLIFMGTPDFAVPCLERLINERYEVAGVFTQPDKPKGRKYVLTPPPVKVIAMKHNIPVYQPNSLKTGEALQIIREINPDVIIVVAYGKILPKDILEAPKYGCINIHASLLPKYRGAAPIQWSVINGEKVTGVTSMMMDEGLDTGDILLTKSTEIGENETASELHDKLSVLGADVLIDTLKQLKNGELKRTKQDDSQATYSPMLDKSLCTVDWSLSAQEVHNKIRGLYSWPIASTPYDDCTVKLYRAHICDVEGGIPGEVMESDKRLVISCGDGKCIEIDELQYENCKRMCASNFLCGRPIEKGVILK